MLGKTVFVNKIKKTVSGDRRRIQRDGYNLDLTYIEENIIAMSFPAAGIEATWRNHIDHVVNFLKKKHGQNFMIWNLSERTYNFDKFDNQILHLPFPDHHPPPLTRLFQIVQTIDNWVRADKRNVSVIHCVGGKGRTGTVISCCLYFNGLFKSIQESLDHFAKKRSALGRGVTQPSQRRYIQYFAKVLRQMKPMRLTKVRLVSVAIGPLSANKVFGLEVYDSPYDGKLLYMSYPEPAALLNFNVNIDVKGDIYIKFTEKSAKHTKKDRFFIVLHASFVTQKHYHFNKRNLDTLEFDKKFAENLSVGIKFGPPQYPSPNPEIDSVIETMRQIYLDERNAEREALLSSVGQNGAGSSNGTSRYATTTAEPPRIVPDYDADGQDDAWSRAKPNKQVNSAPSTTKVSKSGVDSEMDSCGSGQSDGSQQEVNPISDTYRNFSELSSAQAASTTRDRSNGYSYNKNVAYPVPLDTITTALRKIEIHKRRLSQFDHQEAQNAMQRSNGGHVNKLPRAMGHSMPETPSVHYLQHAEQLKRHEEKAALGAGEQQHQQPQDRTKLPILPKAIVLYNFAAKYPEELSIRKGDVVRVTSKAYADWWYGYVEEDGYASVRLKKGYFPRKYVQIMGDT